MKKNLLIIIFLFMGFSNLIGKDISAYLSGENHTIESAKEKLSKAGFEVIAEYESVKDGVTLVFTNEVLKREAAKPKRSHAAVLRLFVDKKKKTISITNPVYFGQAFMQKQYNSEVFEAQLRAINGAFSNLKPSKDRLAEKVIANYHFTIGMPYYQDSDVLAQGQNVDLLQKARTYKNGRNLIFELKLSEDSTLLGYDLDKRTKKFVEKIGRANAALLPYCVSVESNKATSLEAKYYLALSYPLLSMSTFMTIATVPGAIKKELSKVFN